MKDIKITIFTPTYNRGQSLIALFKSLLNQTNHNFEWIVIDDGSTDNTKKYIKQIFKNNYDFKISFLKVEHGGKHRAINKGVSLAKGKLFFILDSDDYLDPNAVELILHVENTLTEKEKKIFAGVCGPKHYFNKKIVGSTFKNKRYLDITYFEREKNFIEGDKAEVFYTDVLKKYPFPEFENEFFLTEAVVWDRIAFDGYKMRYFNGCIYYCEYRNDGLTKNYKKVVGLCPYGDALYVLQKCKLKKLNFRKRIGEYCRFYMRHYEFEKKLKTVASYLNINATYMLFIVIIYKLKHVFNRTMD